MKPALYYSVSGSVSCEQQKKKSMIPKAADDVGQPPSKLSDARTLYGVKSSF